MVDMKHKRTKQKYQQILAHERLEYEMHRTNKTLYYSQDFGASFNILSTDKVS